jgi:Lon protease-like protein
MALEREDFERLPIFPLPQVALFPGMRLPLHVFEPRYRDLVRDALQGSRVLGVPRLRPGYEADYLGRPPVFELCGAGRIVAHERRTDGRFDIELLGLSRVRIVEELPPTESYRVVRAELVPDLPAEPALVLALEQRLASLWPSVAAHLPEALRDLRKLTSDSDDVGAVTDRLASVFAGDHELAQRLLSEPNPAERLHVLTEHLAAAVAAVRPSARSKTDMN